MVLWSTEGIKRVAREVLASDDGAQIVRTQFVALLGKQDTSAIGQELKHEAERRAEAAKASLHRRVNEIYEAQCARLDKELREFCRKLERTAPDQTTRLQKLEDRLRAVQESYEGWLDEPAKELEALVSEQRNALEHSVSKIMNSSEIRIQSKMTQVESQLADLIEQRLHALVVEAVRDHVASAPFEEERLSNKQIAAARGISLRAVKRRHQKGLA